VPALLITSGLPLSSVCASAARVQFHTKRRLVVLRFLTALLHIMQPLARLYGRCAGGLTLWRERTPSRFVWPIPRKMSVWTSHWQMPETRLEAIETALREDHRAARRGGPYDRWDLHLDVGFLGGARMRMVCEDGNKGHQYARFHVSPRLSIPAVVSVCLLGGAASAAASDGVWLVSAVLAACGLALTKGMLKQSSSAMAGFIEALRPQLAEAVASRSRIGAGAQATARSASDTAGAIM
jgi:hypothetical protein